MIRLRMGIFRECVIEPPGSIFHGVKELGSLHFLILLTDGRLHINVERVGSSDVQFVPAERLKTGRSGLLKLPVNWVQEFS